MISPASNGAAEREALLIAKMKSALRAGDVRDRQLLAQRREIL